MFRHSYIFQLLLFVLYVGTVSQVNGQSLDETYIESADEVFRFNSRRLALEQYKLALDVNPDNVKANYMAGICYLLTIEKFKSLPYIEKAYKLDPDYISDLKIGDSEFYPDLPFLLAYSYHLNEQFDNAISYYNEFLEIVNAVKGSVITKNFKGTVVRNVKRRIYECEVGKELTNQGVPVQLEPLANINTEYPDYGPVITGDEQTLVFTSRRPNPSENLEVDRDLLPYEDIFISHKEGDVWGEPERIPDFSTNKAHESVVGVSNDGKTLFLYVTDNGGDIFYSEYSDKKQAWSKPESVGKSINSDYKEQSASISPSGQILFYSSNIPHGFGGFDIYYCEKLSNGKWGSPKNLGPTVNTEWDEDSPIIAPDSKTLFFTSKGHRGMGGYDVFKSVYDKNTGKFSDPVNMGYPINTADDDNQYVPTVDSGRAYYASIKDIGLGDMDIYMIKPGLASDYLASRKQKLKADSVAAQDLSLAPDSSEEADEEILEEPIVIEDTIVEEIVEDAPVVVADTVVEDEVVLKEPEEIKEEPTEVVVEEPVETLVPEDTEEVVDNYVEPEPEPTPTELTTAQIVPSNNDDGIDDVDIDGANSMSPTDPEDVSPIAEPEPLPITPVTIVVLTNDVNTGQKLNPQVKILNPITGKEQILVAVSEGKYEFKHSNPTEVMYTVYAEQPGYVFRNQKVRVPAASSDNQDVIVNLDMRKVAESKGMPVVLRNVYFDFNKSMVKNESFDELQKVVRFMKQNPDVRLEISGHTDNIGNDVYNKRLSQKRSESVVNFMVRLGIDASRLVPKGYGEERPLASNDDEREGREFNRRIEFEILK